MDVLKNPSKTLRWFTNVRWDEYDCFVDCLVDITCSVKARYVLIDDNKGLKIYSYDQFQKLHQQRDTVVIGYAIRWDHYLTSNKEDYDINVSQ